MNTSAVSVERAARSGSSRTRARASASAHGRRIHRTAGLPDPPRDRVVVEADERVPRVEEDGAQRHGYFFTQSPRSVWIHCPPAPLPVGLGERRLDAPGVRRRDLVLAHEGLDDGLPVPRSPRRSARPPRRCSPARAGAPRTPGCSRPRSRAPATAGARPGAGSATPSAGGARRCPSSAPARRSTRGPSALASRGPSGASHRSRLEPGLGAAPGAARRRRRASRGRRLMSTIWLAASSSFCCGNVTFTVTGTQAAKPPPPAEDADATTDKGRPHRAVSLPPPRAGASHVFLTHWPFSSWIQSFGRERSWRAFAKAL